MVDRWSEKNAKARADNDFNRVLREYITYKYGPIAEEFCRFYDWLRDMYPAKRFYKGSRQFRTWVTNQIAEYVASGNEEQVSQEQPETLERIVREVLGEEWQQNQQDEPIASEVLGDEWQQQNQQDSSEVLVDEGQQQQQQQREQPLDHLDELSLADVIEELENAGVPLAEQDDEGIHLDLYEELQADIEGFDYRLEVEMENIFW